MPLTADTAGLRRLQRHINELAKRDGRSMTTVLESVRDQVNARIKYQFEESLDPEDYLWDRTTKGKLALVSAKLPGAFRSRIERGELRFVARPPRDWLLAHQLGHVFPARHVGRGGTMNRTETRKRRDGSTYEFTVRPGVMFFNAKGRLKKARQGARMKRGRAVFARAHTVGQRVLPKRWIAPQNRLTGPWNAAVQAGVTIGMRRWAERAPR